MDVNISELEAKAESGDAESQYALGLRLFNGDGCTKDLATAFTWCMKAAEHDHANAQLAVANCFDSGSGVAQNLNEAFLWYQKSSNLGNSYAASALAYYYERGIATAMNPEEALNYYKKSAELGNINSFYTVVNHYLKTVKDYEKALVWLERITEVFPCYSSRELKVDGFISWFSTLGEIYLNGVSEPDASGNVISKNHSKAYRIFKSGAFANDRMSIFRLLGMKNDADVSPYLITDKEAAIFAMRGAALGCSYSELFLGDSFSVGGGVPKSAAEAVNWWTKAAYQDVYIAQYKLGVAFQDGVGVARDLIEAYAWFNLAAAGAPYHESKCKEARDSLEVSLTPDQLVSAQKRSTEIHASLKKR